MYLIHYSQYSEDQVLLQAQDGVIPKEHFGVFTSNDLRIKICAGERDAALAICNLRQQSLVDIDVP